MNKELKLKCGDIWIEIYRLFPNLTKLQYMDLIDRFGMLIQIAEKYDWDNKRKKDENFVPTE